MIIGILTIPFNNNYGGFLQAFALKTILTQMGHTVVFLNRQRDQGKELKFRIYRWLVKLGIIKDFLAKRRERLSRYTDEFKACYLSPITNPCYDTKSLEKCCKKENIECCVVGSDQVWRYQYAKGSIDDFYLKFIDDDRVVKISYAASFGIDEMDYPEAKLHCIKTLLSKFRAISVREKSGKRLINDYFGISGEKVKVVLDPTMLLSNEIYKKLFDKSEQYKALPSKYLFTYILDKNPIINTIIEDLSKERGIEHFDICAETGDITKIEYIEPVEKWLSAIYHAEFVVTDSFHGTVFSILFNRPFIVVANPSRGLSRISDLLERFGLENRIYDNSKPWSQTSYPTSINWKVVNQRIEDERKMSFNFLINNLNEDVD